MRALALEIIGDRAPQSRIGNVMGGVGRDRRVAGQVGAGVARAVDQGVAGLAVRRDGGEPDRAVSELESALAESASFPDRSKAEALLRELKPS